MLRSNILLGIGLCLLSQVAQAAAADLSTTEVTDQCMVSIRNVYRFYYHEVHPNADPACHTNQKMSDKAAQEMQGVITELKNNCPASIIAQVNQTLQLDTQVG